MQHVRMHRTECYFGNHKCPFAKISGEMCTWCGPLIYMKKHVKQVHKGDSDVRDVSGSFQICIKITFGSANYRQAIFTLDRMFYIYSKVVDRLFYCAVLYVGPKAETTLFRYRLTICGKTGKEVISHLLCTLNFMEDIDEVIENGKCVVVHYGNLERFLKENHLQIEIEIFKSEVASGDEGTHNDDDNDDE